MTKAKFFAVLIDETTDVSRKERASITLRYVSNEEDVNEKFISCVEAPDVTGGGGLGKLLLTNLKTLGLDIADPTFAGRATTGHPPCQAGSTGAKRSYNGSSRWLSIPIVSPISSTL